MSDFVFVGRRSIKTVPFYVYDANGDLAASDTPPVVAMKAYVDDTQVFSRATTLDPEVVGKYDVTISSVESKDPGFYYLEYTYALGGVPQIWVTDVEVPQASASAYEALGPNNQPYVESVWLRFEDLFDSAEGGPHLREYAQSSFGRERVAQLMSIAIGRINISSQPHQTYSLYDGSFPYSEWGGLIDQATYVEALKHLIRSYTEQPNPQGLQTVRLDRSQYAQGWRAILNDEEKILKDMLDNFKIASLNLGGAHVLAGGGVYGEYVRPVPVSRPRHRPPVRLW